MKLEGIGLGRFSGGYAVALAMGILLGWGGGVQGGVELAEFEWRQDLQVSESGLVRERVPMETMGYARAGLADLRLVGPGGEEVPYWLERPSAPRLERIGAKRLEVFAEEGVTRVLVHRRADGEVRGIGLDIPSAEFYKAVTVLDSSGRVLAQNQPVFRQRGGVERSVIDLDSTSAEEFTLLIRDDRTDPVVVRGVYFEELNGERVLEEVMGVEMSEALESEGGSDWLLGLGAAGVRLGQLSVEVEDRLFDRRIQLFSRQAVGGETREVEVWSGRIYRLDMGGGVMVEQVQVPVGVEVGSRELLVRVAHGDSPALRIRGFGLTRRPVMLGFRASSAGVYRAYMGSRLLGVPQYDLDALSSRMGSMRGVRCDWGVVVPNPVYDDSVGLPVQEGLAGVIDVSDWSFRRGVTMGDRGAIQELELDSWVLARCRQGLEDVRLVSQGRQVPFILEKEGVSRSFALPGLLERDAVRPGVSRWRMELPDENIPVIRIACEVGTPFFDRVWKLYEEVEGSARGRSERLLDRGRWVRDLEDQGGVLWLSVGMRPRGRVLFLELDNGDNPELEIQSFSAYFRAPRLYFQAPAGGGVELVCGNRLVEAPVYDLALLAPQVMAARRVRAELGEVGEVSLGSTRNEVGGGAVTVFFWGVLILVVGGLSFLIMRLLPKESGEGE